MANLSRFNPFSDITRSTPFGKLDELFDNLENIRPSRMWEPAPRIKMDVAEDKQSYTVHGETREGERTVHAERYYGRESRSIMLDHEVDEKKSVAKYENGVLELKLPILEASRAAHHLPIQ